MLRRRKSTILPSHPTLEESNVSEDKRQWKQLTVRKLKMSPYPERTGWEHGRENKQVGELAHVCTSLDFSEEECKCKGEDCLNEEVREDVCSREGSMELHPTVAQQPSKVMEIEQQMSTAVTTCQPKKSSISLRSPPPPPPPPLLSQESDQSSTTDKPAGLKNMWDSVVSWMKMAVDFIALDSPAEADPSKLQSPCRKRRLVDADPGGPQEKVARCEERRERRQDSFGGRSKMGKGRTSFGAFRFAMKSKHSGSSGAGLGELIHLEPVKEQDNGSRAPTGKPPSLMLQSPASVLAHNLTLSLQMESPLAAATGGLNSLFSPYPSSLLVMNEGGTGRRGKVSIRRPALRHFYGRSVHRPNLQSGTVSNPHLEEKKPSAVPSVPPPPPPPPLPPLPPLQQHTFPSASTRHGIPCAPPTPRLAGLSHDSHLTDSSTPVDHSRDVLQRMQNRLRNRMKKRGGGGGGGGGGEEGSNEGTSEEVETKNSKGINLRVCQWAEIQARSRKLSIDDFLFLAEQKKQLLQTTLEALENGDGMPDSLAAVAVLLEQLNEGSQWYPGGSKEMREELPLFKTMEWKVDLMNEYVQICTIMQSITHTSKHTSGVAAHLHSTLEHIKEEFNLRHRQWEATITSDGSSWLKLGLPLESSLLSQASQYLCSLVTQFTDLVLGEASKISGILVSMKCTRTTQAKERLKESLNMLHMALPYFSRVQQPPSSTPSSSPSSSTEKDSLPLLQQLCTQVAHSYITVALEQFNGFVQQSERQVVMEHFEGILKVLGLVKSTILKLPTASSISRRAGILSLLPDSGELTSSLHSSCVCLIEHIASRTQGYLSAHASNSHNYSRELVLWMMFGCKYVNQTLDMLGSQQAGDMGVQSLLADLQNMEDLLPN